MNKWIFGFIALFGFQAEALNLQEWQSVTVKILSFPCQGKKPLFEGSGLIVKGDTGFQVFTSDHVLISSGDKEVCHKVLNDVVGEQKVILQKFDYLNGMALLQFEKETSLFNLPNVVVKDLQMALPTKEVVALGVPAGTVNLHTLSGGKMVGMDQRSLIPLLKEMYEINQLPVEFGMSGGVILEKANGDQWNYAGMLTHQYLKRSGGGASSVQIMNPGEIPVNGTDFSLGIPGSTVKEWVTENNIGDGVNWQRNFSSQNLEVSTSYGPLLFENTTVDSKYLAVPGNDGSGIGGKGETQNKTPQALKMNLNKKWISDNLQTTDLKNTELSKWYQWLLKGESLQIIAAVKIFDDGESDIQFIYSPEQFLTLWLRDNYIPLVTRENLNEIDSKIEKAIQLARDVRQATSHVKFSNEETRVWLEGLKAKTYLVENLYLQRSLFEKEIKELSTFGSVIAIDLYDADFESAQELSYSIEKLSKELL